MKFRILIIALTTLLLLPSMGQAADQVDQFQKLSLEQGLSQSVVMAMLQDQQGFMWFGTQDGLNQYNGYEFSIFQHAEGESNTISGNYVHTLLQDDDDFIWIGTDKHGLTRFNPRTREFKSFRHHDNDVRSLSDDQVLSLVVDQSGTLYVGTQNGLNRYDRESQLFERIDLSVGSTKPKLINALLEDRNGRLWIGTNAGLLCWSEDRQDIRWYQHRPNDPNSLSDNTVHCLYQSQDGDLLVGTDKGINAYRDYLNGFDRYLPADPNRHEIEVYALTEDSRQNLWIGTFGAGLYRYDYKARTLNHYQQTQEDGSLSNNFVVSLQVDRSGVLWVGTYGGGINKLDLVRVRFGHIGPKENGGELPGDDVYAIFDTEDGPVAFGTDNGVAALNQLTGQTFYLNHDPAHPNLGLSNNKVYALMRDYNQNFWVGTGGSGLDRISVDTSTFNFRVEHYKHEKWKSNSLADDQVLCMLETTDKKLWIGTADGLSMFSEMDNNFTNYKREVEDRNALTDNEILCLAELPDGDIIMGTNDGVFRFEIVNKRFVRFPASDGHKLLEKTVYSLLIDSRGDCWMGTDGFGVWRYSPESKKTEVYSQSSGLPNDIIYGILEDDEGNVWLSTDYGLSCLKRQTDPNQFSVINYSTENWLPCNEFNIGASFRNQRGVLFFGCNQGVVYFHHEDIKGNTYVPPVTLTDFRLFFEPVAIDSRPKSILKEHIGFTESLELNYEQNMLYFEFAALNYIESDNNQYAFYLEGLEEDWNYVRENRSATYTNLDPGEYTFHVKASNNAGVWNEEGTTIKITITPPFYHQIWFYFLCIAAGSALVFLIVLKRTQEARQIRKELERMVQERTREVVAQKEKIEHSNTRLEQISLEIATQRDQVAEKNEELNATLDKLTKTQTKLVASEKMASLGQLTAGVAHEINNPINFVSGNVQPLKRDINDLLDVLSRYENTIKEQGLGDRFEEVKRLKDELDFDFMIQEIGQLIEGIEVGARRTAEIVKGLKNFSRLDENESKLANLNEGINSTLLILQSEFKNRVEVEQDLGNIPSILCYPGKLNQVFMNILSNAGQSIEDGGKIFIKTWADKNFVHISIRDTGKGMSEEVKNHIFEPFFTTKDVGRGTGLGLSISFGIIENHFGSIKVESELGKGSEFTINLPLHRPDEEQTPEG